MLTCYAQSDKKKSLRVMQALADGCNGNGQVRYVHQPWVPGPSAFYGVRPPWLHLWNQAKGAAVPVFYLDNAWFDCAREKYFRIGVNNVQSWSRKVSDGTRLARLGVRVQRWTSAGRNVLVCPQTDEFMRTVAGYPDWLRDAKTQIAQFTNRPIVVRNKLTMRPLKQDLRDAWIVVTHSSCAAIEALCAGVPVIVTDPKAAAVIFSTSFHEIEKPRRPEGRLEFMARLADSQFTLEELRNGAVWQMTQDWL